MISHKYKCIFIHIPKCAGTSVETAFEGSGGVEKLLRCRTLFETAEKYPNYFRFTVVRDPLTRAASAWGHSQLLRSRSQNPPGVLEKIKRELRRSVLRIRCFEEYLEVIQIYLRRNDLYERLKTTSNIAEFGKTW